MPHRMHRPRAVAAIVLALAATLVMLAGPLAASAATFSIRLSLGASGLSPLTQVTNAGDGTNRLFLVERRGTVRSYRNGAIQPGFFIDIRSLVLDDGSERGLLGLAFDPRFRTNHRLYVYYTRVGGDIVLRQYTANSTRTRVSLTTGRNILVIEHSARANHNGGALAFGPNGYLYIGVGDGGGAGDPFANGQSRTKNLLAKVLRINVHGTGAGLYGRYSIPPSNPFAGARTGRDEVWAYGLRNPWRISFDRGTGRLFIADVGQSSWEEVDREPGGYAGGRNYGWSVMEGKHCYAATTCVRTGKTLPVAEYSHVGGNCSITGGYVYRGHADPALVGQYVFADYCSGRIWTMASGGVTPTLRADTAAHITSFCEGESGELWAVTIGGRLYRIRVS